MKDFEYNPITNELDLVGGGVGGVERLIVNISHTPGQGEAADKTYAEIETAINAGKIVTVRNLASEYVYSHTVESVGGSHGKHHFYNLGQGVINNLDILSDETVEIRTTEYMKRATSLPIPSALNYGEIYHYVGADTNLYKHGYFYECTESGGVYSWQRVNVQPGADTRMMSLDFGDYEDTISVVNVFGAVKITEVATNGNVASVKLSHGSTVRQTVTPGEVDIDIASGETMIWEITRSTDNTAAALGVKLNIIGG